MQMIKVIQSKFKNNFLLKKMKGFQCNKFFLIRKIQGSTIHKQIYQVFIYLIILILFVSVITNFSLHISNSNIKKIENVINQQIILSSKIQVYSLQTSTIFQRYLTGNNSINDVKVKLNEIDETTQLLVDSFKEHRKDIQQNNIMKEVAAFKSVYKSLQEYTDKLPTVFLDYSQATKDTIILLSLDRMDKMYVSSNNINQYTVDYTKPIIKNINKQNNRYAYLSISIAIIAVITSLYFVFAITSSVKSFRNGIYQSIKNLVDETNDMMKIASNVRIDANNSNTNLFSLSNNIDFFLLETDEISSCIDEVSSGIYHVSNMNQELTNSATTITNFVDKTQTMICSFDNKFQKNITDVNNIIDNLNEKLLKITRASNSVLVLSDKINNIQSILTSITNISKKTNLLAINASIEATHAGEYGKGFSVVAQEIRDLANKSSQNAKEIEKIVKELISFSSKTVHTLKNSTKEAVTSVDETKNIIIIFNDVSKIFSSIVYEIEEIKKLTDTMFNNSFKTNNESEQIKSYAQNISSKTQVFLSSFQEFASILIKVTNTTKNSLDGIDNQFKLLDSQKKSIENIYLTVEKL